MAKPKPIFTMQRMPGLQPVEIRVFGEDKKTVKEIIKFTTLNVYDHPLTFIVTPLQLSEVPKLGHLKEYNALCVTRDAWLQNLFSMGKANPKAVRIAMKKEKSPNASGYWAAVKAFNTERFSKNPDPKKLQALSIKKQEMHQRHVAEMHAPVEKANMAFHDETKFKELRQLHEAIEEKFKAATRYMKADKWNEKSIRKFYSKYGFK